VTPRFADWVTSPNNILWTSGVLDHSSSVVELGCGISGLLSLVLAPNVGLYIATDQEHVLKWTRLNLTRNMPQAKKKQNSKSNYEQGSISGNSFGNIAVKSLDWETDSVRNLYQELGLVPAKDKLNALIACDCIYNEALIKPFVETCADICRLAPASSPTICVIAQQLRSSDVFEAWLKTFHSHFRVWILAGINLSPELSEDSGFVVHIGILRPEIER